VLKMALKGDLPKDGKPETRVVKTLQSETVVGKLKMAAALGALAGVAWWLLAGRRRC